MLVPVNFRSNRKQFDANFDEFARKNQVGRREIAGGVQRETDRRCGWHGGAAGATARAAQAGQAEQQRGGAGGEGGGCWAAGSGLRRRQAARARLPGSGRRGRELPCRRLKKGWDGKKEYSRVLQKDAFLKFVFEVSVPCDACSNRKMHLQVEVFEFLQVEK
jgi:hypothetical protein